jgi:hypothetical protein
MRTCLRLEASGWRVKLSGCSSAPRLQADSRTLETEANITFDKFKAADPDLQKLIQNAALPPRMDLACAAVFLAALILMAAGCQTPIKTEFNSERDFSAYRTFAQLPLPQTSPASDPGLIARLSEPVRMTLSSTLTAKGYQEVAQDTADFTVSLRGASLPRVDVKTTGYLYPVGRWQRNYGAPVRRVDVRAYEERTLAVEIFDNKTKELDWVGWLTEDSRGRVETDKVLEGIRRVLAGFPPGGAASPK